MSHQQVVKDKHSTGLNAIGGGVAWIIALCTLGYLIPWAIAVSRGKTNSTGIFFVNLLLGWTVIGWLVALVMACTSHGIIQPTYVTVQQVAPAALPASGPAAGWYAQDGVQRYWDGAAWTEHTA